MTQDARDAILTGRTALGIEFGSTRIKACLIDAESAAVLAVGSHGWENELVDRVWTYPLDAVWTGVQHAVAELAGAVERDHGVPLTTVGAIGVSAMMHGYLAFDEHGELLVPFRTWRNTSTSAAADELSDLLGVNIPLRWSIAHLHQAVLDDEPHLSRLRRVTTLAGYVHERLSGVDVLGVGDASGMFPIDAATGGYDAALVQRYDALAADRLPVDGILDLLPGVLTAGDDAGSLTADGAALLDPTGRLRAGAPMCPPEGDAGTGMVATDSITPGTGNVSAGTSIFAMVVLERPLTSVHQELDVVMTPAGDPVAMVHCNNGASELAEWARLFERFAVAAGRPMTTDEVFQTLLLEALEADADAGGIIAYNLLAGEPILQLPDGRPMLVRTPDSSFSLANLIRAHLHGAFATLSIGMRVLADEGVRIDRMFAHGGIFRTAGVAQRMLANALDAPVAVAATASEGGAWGMAVLASLRAVPGRGALAEVVRDHVFADVATSTVDPDPAGVAGYAVSLDRFVAGIPAVRAAAESVSLRASVSDPKDPR
jgi:sugar (pentulose or hexulose) kinase